MQYDDHLAIDKLCDRFEQELRAGQNPDLADFVNQSGVDSDVLIENLIRVHADYSLESSNKIDVHNYEKLGNRFVEFAMQLASDSIGSADVSNSLDLNSAISHTAASKNAIGPYQLIEKLGEGGMGTVWKAQQSEPVKREVAIKVIKTGVDSNEVLKRFDAERQALAIMNHPNIARIIDAGTTADGKPYFAMELVDGQPITIFCDQNKLNIEQRLKLFVQACHGIQHAHQKGIIHRDLKPSNVLVAHVDGKPVPKIIDFGLAKATENAQRLTDESLYTGIGQVMGTVKYMSPEQASLNTIDIDTRTDIYSLGVILYELLVGTTALDSKSIKDQSLLHILEAIREVEPYWPSKTLIAFSDEVLFNIASKRNTKGKSLIRNISGDLDWIVMKSLEKDRSRRYESAYGLSADIDRYLNAEPIVARKISRFDRALRWAKRKPLQAGFLGVSVLAALLIVITFVGVRYQNELSRLNSSLKQKNIDLDQSLLNEASARARAENSNNELTKTNELLDAANLDLTKTNEQLEIAKTNEETAKQQLETAIDFQRYQTAYDLWNKGDVASAAAIFKACKKRNGAWDWNYLNKTIAENTIESIQLPSIPLRVKFSPTGRRLIFTYLGRIEFRSAKDYSLEISIPVNKNLTLDFATDSSEQYFVAAGYNGIAIWDVESKTQIHQPISSDIDDTNGTFWAVDFIPEKKTFFCGSGNGKIYKVNAVDGSIELFINTGHGQITDIEVDSSGKHLIYSAQLNSGTINLEKKKIVQTFRLEGWSYKDERVVTVPQLDLLVTCGGGPLNFWDLSTGKLIESKHTINGNDLRVLSADANFYLDRLALGCSNGRIHIYNLTERKYLHTLKKPMGQIHDVSFAPRSSILASASHNQVINIWSSEKPINGKIIGGADFDLREYYVSPCSRWVLTLGVDRSNRFKYVYAAKIWNMSGTLVWEYKSEDNSIIAADWDVNAQQVCLIELPAKQQVEKRFKLKILDWTTGKELSNLVGVRKGCFSADGNLIWTLEGKNSLKLRNYKNGSIVAVLNLDEFEDSISNFNVSNDGKYLFTVSRRLACCYSLNSPEDPRLIKRFQLPRDEVFSYTTMSNTGMVALSAQSLNYSKTKLPKTTIFDVDSNTEIIFPILLNRTTHVSFEPNNMSILTSHFGLMPSIWNLKSGYRTMTLHHGKLKSLQKSKFSPDGRYLFGTDGNQLYVWDKTNGYQKEHTQPVDSAQNDAQRSNAKISPH